MLKDFMRFPWYIVTHPIDGFYDMKFEKKGRLKVALVFIALVPLVKILAFLNTGFIVNHYNPYLMNSIMQIIYSIMPILLFCVANWSITTLVDGKGKFKEIVMVVGYAAFPYLIISILNMLYSNFIVPSESAFYFFFKTLAYIMMLFLIFTGTMVIHEFTVKREIVTVILTLVAMGVIIFVALLFFSVIQQMQGFIYSIYKELTLRM